MAIENINELFLDPSKIEMCSKCGSKSHMMLDEATQKMDFGVTRELYYCVCVHCASIGPKRLTIPSAIAAWNTRDYG